MGTVPHFPFAAIVGQGALKRALLLGVIHPGLGGVLVRGTKGLAKSTAVRALAGLLPPIETVAGCPFQREPGADVPAWPLPADAAVVTRPAPLVELPLGATEDRVLGTLHLEKAFRGERAFEPGLLAAANRGILYIDEVNLLPDHLVDVLLDAAAGGVHRVEREGISVAHPARFTLVGTMNPEEGDLRPQLLDRFGLVVDLADLADAAERAEAVRRRLRYEADPSAFAAMWRPAEETEAQRVRAARELLPRVTVSDELVEAASVRCLAAGAEGLRADLTLCRAACAWAAYEGRTAVEAADLDAVAELALGHRRRTPPAPPPPNGHRPEHGPPASRSQPEAGRRPTDSVPTGQPQPAGTPPPSMVFASAGLFAPRVSPSRELIRQSKARARGRAGSTRHLGPASGPAVRYEAGHAVALAATLRAAALRGGQAQPDDWRGRPRRGPGGCLILFVVDASGSMATRQRMRQTKAAVRALLVRAYQRRDRVAMLAFAGHEAHTVLPPAAGLPAACAALEDLPVGGPTPLAHGLEAAGHVVRAHQRRQPGQPVWSIVLTDGRANVARSTADPWHDALDRARELAGLGAECLVIDTEAGWVRLGQAAELARALGAPCIAVEDVLGRPVADHWRRAV